MENPFPRSLEHMGMRQRDPYQLPPGDEDKHCLLETLGPEVWGPREDSIGGAHWETEIWADTQHLYTCTVIPRYFMLI